jgi:hypothetical protein
MICFRVWSRDNKGSNSNRYTLKLLERHILLLLVVLTSFNLDWNNWVLQYNSYITKPTSTLNTTHQTHWCTIVLDDICGSDLGIIRNDERNNSNKYALKLLTNSSRASLWLFCCLEPDQHRRRDNIFLLWELHRMFVLRLFFLHTPTYE